MTSGAWTIWLADHPRIRRTLVAMTLNYTLLLAAMVCAPRAFAAGGAAALGWTGLHDTDGVPIAYYFLSVVAWREAATNNGTDVSLDPSSWLPWIGAAMERAVDNATAAWWLGMFTGAFIFIMAATLWFLRFALSTGWLVAIASIGFPLYNSVNSMVSHMLLGAIAITVCAIVAGYHILNHNEGRGWAVAGTALVFTVLLATVFSDPVGDLYSEDGLLALGRGTGLEIAQGAIGAPFASGASLDAKLDALMSNVVTAGVRHPLQVVNFGMVVDDIGGCRQAWSAAIMAAQGVDGPGPAHAMGNCGAPQALAYAQRLGGTDATIALVLVVVSIVVGFFFWYVGLSVMLVGIKALYFGILVGPCFLLGMMGFGRAAEFAKHCGTELFMHVAQLGIFEVYLAVSAIGLTWVLTSNAFGASTSTAIPRVLLMAVAAAALWLGFRFVDRSFHTDGMGTIARQIRSVWHAGTGRVREEAAPYRDGARNLRGRFRRSGDAGDKDSSADESKARPLPGMEWFKPRATNLRSTRAGAVATSGGQSPAANTSSAKESATTAAVAVAKVAAPEVAVPVAAAAKAAGVAGHVLKNDKTSPSPGSGAHPARSEAPTTRPRPPRGEGPAASAPTPRTPAQVSTMANRSTGASDNSAGSPQQAARPMSGAGSDGSGPSHRHADEAAHLESGAVRPHSRPRTPREIGS
ncbi:hypothetical protein VXE65_32695 [Mycolicibacterium conceptionense]|uniref:hypothetical protein n=1 Tax=Mycolicibacterium conceptionense TaxID=451644 RepID=UPI0032049B5C